MQHYFMQQQAILLPFFGMMLVTLTVWGCLFIRRIGYLTANKINAEQLTTRDKLASLVPETVQNPSNCLQNLFELPVLFYALCLYLYFAGLVDTGFLVAAYIFLLARALQALVHCTYNGVNHRFIAYLVSSFALWFMVIRAALAII